MGSCSTNLYSFVLFCYLCFVLFPKVSKAVERVLQTLVLLFFLLFFIIPFFQCKYDSRPCSTDIYSVVFKYFHSVFPKVYRTGDRVQQTFILLFLNIFIPFSPKYIEQETVFYKPLFFSCFRLVLSYFSSDKFLLLYI